ncbi:MAG: hypothetical protein M3Z85_04760 [Acidobacteriota bacterium]|nr:hypothetical protein [Acidobacteriota bacterium]
MITSGRQAKKPRSHKASSDSEVWDFLDRQPNNGASSPHGHVQVGPVGAPAAASNGSSQGGVDSMLLEYWDQPNEMQLNIRLPANAKKMIERLARRKTVGVSTLVRMWVIESLRREARQL